MNDPPERFFARATSGTEEIAASEIASVPGASVTAVSWRQIDFCANAPPALLSLRSVDDVYAHVGRLTALGHTKAALTSLAQQIDGLPWREALRVCCQVRAIPQRPTYAVTASMVGPHRNYSRYDVGEAVRQGMPRSLGWTYLDQRDRTATPDLDLRVLLEDDSGVIGIRLGDRPLHRREYKAQHLPGSLKPPVAYCMARLAGIDRGDIVLDPTCGVGTIAIEATSLLSDVVVVAGDLNPMAVHAAATNTQRAVAHVGLFLGDATRLPLPDASVTRIVCNLPWGQQAGTPESLEHTYQLLVSECVRVLADDGRVVLLTDRTPLLWAPLERTGRLHLTFAQQISLYGSHPTIVVLALDTARPDALLTPTDTAWHTVYQRALRDGPTHPDPAVRAWATIEATRI